MGACGECRRSREGVCQECISPVCGPGERVNGNNWLSPGYVPASSQRHLFRFHVHYHVFVFCGVGEGIYRLNIPSWILEERSYFSRFAAADRRCPHNGPVIIEIKNG